MGIGKFGGTSFLWVMVIVAGLLVARDWVRQQFVAILNDSETYAVFPESTPIETSDFTFDGPMFPEGTYYNPDE